MWRNNWLASVISHGLAADDRELIFSLSGWQGGVFFPIENTVRWRFSFSSDLLSLVAFQMKSVKGIPPLLTCQALRDLLRSSPRKVSVLEADIGKQFEKEFQQWVCSIQSDPLRHMGIYIQTYDLVLTFHKHVTSINWNVPNRRNRFLVVFPRSNASKRIFHVWESPITITLCSTIVHRWVSMPPVVLGGCLRSVTLLVSIWNDGLYLDVRSR